MCIIFRFKKQQLEEFWTEMLEVKERSKDGFYLYMAKERP